MKIISIGRDKLGDYDLERDHYGDNSRPLLDDSNLFIYHYTDHGYEGSGLAIWRTNKGRWGYSGLGHCSCYGPTEEIKSGKLPTGRGVLFGYAYDKEREINVANDNLETVKMVGHWLIEEGIFLNEV